jgi:aminodeoxyfutalosine synthase
MSDWRQMLGIDLLTLGMAADTAKREGPWANVVTYQRVHSVTAAELAGGAAIPDAASEVRLYATPATLEEAIAQVRALAAAAGGRRVAAFSAADLEARSWGTLSGVLRSLAGAGLQDVAELPADRVGNLSASIGALHDAGISPQRITVSHPVGAHRVELLTNVQETMTRHPSVRRFAPLPRMAPVDKPTTGYEDVRAVALARLALSASSIEVDWTLYGPKLAQVALTFGADHLDAVPATDDVTLGRRRATVEDVQRNIRAAGFKPREYIGD